MRGISGRDKLSAQLRLKIHGENGFFEHNEPLLM
jgi:hypothetical protein